MAFQQIKGQAKVIDFFRTALAQQRLAHAYLFLGPQGVGKALLARNLAKFLNCESPLREQSGLIDCCDRCLSCRKIEEDYHPDVHWLRSRTTSAKISIDEIRTLQKEVSLKTYEGKFKIFIIDDAQELTEQAAHSLLKTLEEPPSASILILITTHISGLLPTIISRCQVIKFAWMRYEDLKRILIEDYKLDSVQAHFFAAISEGRLGAALHLKEQDVLSKKNGIIDRICQVPRPPRAVDIFNLKDKSELFAQINYILNWFRDIAFFKTGLTKSNIINADRIESIKTISGRFSFEQVEQIIERINQAHWLIQQNVNPKIALEVMLREIPKCKR